MAVSVAAVDAMPLSWHVSNMMAVVVPHFVRVVRMAVDVCGCIYSERLAFINGRMGLAYYRVHKKFHGRKERERNERMREIRKELENQSKR